jgi:hypothetical protein
MLRSTTIVALVLATACATNDAAQKTPEPPSDDRPEWNALVLTFDTQLDRAVRIERIESRVDGAGPHRKEPLSPGEHEIEVTVALDAGWDDVTLTKRAKASALDGIVYATTTFARVGGRWEMTLSVHEARPKFLPVSPPGGKPARAIEYPLPGVPIETAVQLRHGGAKYGNIIICAAATGETASITFGTFTLPTFDASIVEAVRRWRFDPAKTSAGERVPSCFKHQMNVRSG